MEQASVTGAPVEYRRWLVPDHAVHVTSPGTRAQGMRPSPTTKVEALQLQELDAMAAAWVTDLYTRAGKPAPRLTRP